MSETKSRTVAKIDITITIDQPDPMPFLPSVDIANGKWGTHDAIIARSQNGKLFLVAVDGVGYVVDTKEIVQAIVNHVEQSQS